MEHENQNMDNQATQESAGQPANNQQPVAAPVDYGNLADQKGMAVLAHVLGLITGFVGPLILYFVAADKPWVKENSKNALNFQILLLIAIVVVTIISVITCGFGAILYIPVLVVDAIFCIMAAVKVNKNEAYKYPITINFIKK